MRLETINTKETVITLKEITDILEVRHDKAMIKVQQLSKEPEFGTVSILDIVYNDKGQTTKTYSLTKLQAIAVGAKLNNSLLMKLVIRLENKPKTQLELAREQVALLERLEQLEQEKQYAIETKTWISDKKTATAMNTASQAVKKANKLELELDKTKEYCTIKRMTMLTHGQYFNWRLLKSATIEMECDTVDVFDANYGTVKAYHRDVWLEVYGLEF